MFPNQIDLEPQNHASAQATTPATPWQNMSSMMLTISVFAMEDTTEESLFKMPESEPETSVVHTPVQKRLSPPHKDMLENLNYIFWSCEVAKENPAEPAMLPKLEPAPVTESSSDSESFADFGSEPSKQKRDSAVVAEMVKESKDLAARQTRMGARECRRFFTRREHEFLQAEYEKNPNWRVKDTKRLAAILDVSRIKVYKWHYDYKRLQL